MRRCPHLPALWPDPDSVQSAGYLRSIMVDYWPFPPIDLREPWIDPKPQVFLFGGAPARPSTGKSAADPLGLDRRVIRELIAELGPHEFLYIGDGRIYRVEG